MMIGKHSNETRQKMSDSQKARWQSMSDEKRQSIRHKQSESMKYKQDCFRFVMDNKEWLRQAVKEENEKRMKRRAQKGK